MSDTQQKRFHPLLAAVPLLVVCVVLVSWRTDQSPRATHQSTVTSLASSTSATSTGYDDDSTCSCSLSLTCSVEGQPLLGGVDFVQYFTDFALPDGTYNESNTGKVGLSTISSTVGNFVTYFLTEDNKALFDANPTAYLPAWGGYCSWGISEEYCPDYPWDVSCLGPPGVWSHWTIIDGQLYFFFDEDPKAYFLEDSAFNIEKGNERWSSWFPTDPYAEMNTECHYPKDSTEVESVYEGDLIDNMGEASRGKWFTSRFGGQ
jgi:YHS domain-containing protein